MRVAFRIVAILFLYLFFFALLVNAIFYDKISLKSLKVNSFTKPGKDAYVEIDNRFYNLKLNLLDHIYFKEDRIPGEKIVFIVGGSHSANIPPMKFSSKGTTFKVYTFSIGGNYFFTSLKLFSILSEFSPDYLLLGITPLAITDHYDFEVAPFGDECLGAFANLSLEAANIYETHDHCDYKAQERYSIFSGIISLMADLALSFQNFISIKEINLKKIEAFRSTLASIEKDLKKTLSSPKEVAWQDLGELNRESIALEKAKLKKEILEYLTNSEPSSANGEDIAFHWNENHSITQLKPEGFMEKILSATKKRADKRNIKLILYNVPTAFASKRIYPNTYYNNYERALRDLAKRLNVPLIDEGRLLPFKKNLMIDFVHAEKRGRELFSKDMLLNYFGGQVD